MKESLEKMKESETQIQSGQSNLSQFFSQEKEDISINYIEGADELEIICDNRETASSVVRDLSLMGINIRLEQLEVADYVISQRVGIERKSAQDFNDSIKDGRLFNELINLRNSFERAILILEGDPFLNSNINENALYGAITSIILNLGIIIYKTKDAKETANFLYHLAKKEQSVSESKVKLRFDKAPIEISHLLEYIVAGIPGVNALRAKNLLRELKTLQNIINADLGDLLKVENIGKKIAQEIYKIARFKYRNGSS